MKVFDVKKRVKILEETIEGRLNNEYDFYKSLCNEYSIFGKNYNVCKHINYQVRTTLSCNCSCAFCIEQMSCKNLELKTKSFFDKLDLSLKELQRKDIKPSITITGGEPCLDKKKLIGILDVIKNNDIQKFNLNTNGILLNNEIIDKIKEVKMPYLNISLHHYDLDKNKEIFGGNGITLEQLKYIKKMLGGTYHDTTRVRFQCVLMKGGIDSITEIKKFLNFIQELGFDNVAFRGLSKLKNEGDLKLHNYCEERALDVFPILNNLDKDFDFNFNCQNISDHYMYEDWIYGKKEDFYGMDVHFAYSDMNILEEVEKKELSDNKLYAREFVLYEDGSFCGGWNKDIKFIL